MYKQSKPAGYTAAIGLAFLLSSGVATASPLAVTNTFVPNTPATAASVNQNFDDVEAAVNDNDSRITTNSDDIADNFSAINANSTDIGNNFSALDQRLNRVESGTTQTVAVDCSADSAALKNMALTPNTTYVLTGICDGQIIVSGPELGTIVIKGDAVGTKNDGITLQAGAPTDGTVFAAIYGSSSVRLFLENLVIDASAYNSAFDLFIAAVGAYRASHVILQDVDLIGGDQGLGAYNTGTASIETGVRILNWGLNGIRADRASVVRAFGAVEIAGGTNQDHTASEAVAAYSGGVIDFSDDGNPGTSHSISPSSGPNISIVPDDNVAAVSAWQNGVIKMRDANITGVVWSGDSSVVDLRGVTQQNGYLNPYRNSVMRFRDSQIGMGSAADMSIYAGDFSVFRLDNTTVGNASGTEIASTYRYGVIDLRGTTDFGGRDINCADGREISIRSSVINVGTISCIAPP